MMTKYIQKTLLSLFLLGMLFSYSRAEENLLPEVMVGQPKVTAGTNTYYGGFSGSEAVYNHTNETGTVANPKSNIVPGQIMGQRLAPSLNFNGTSSYVDLGQAPDITGTGAFAISVWAKRTRASSTPREDVIISQAKDYFGDYRLYFSSNGTLKFRVTGTDTTVEPPDYPHLAGESMVVGSGANTYAYNENVWHHIVAIRNADGKTGSLWVDGQDVSVAEDSTSYRIEMKSICPQGNGCTDGAAVKTLIGQLGWDNAAYSIPGHSYSDGRGFFGGSIDEVRTYTKALSSEEINKLYTGTTQPEDNVVGSSGLKAYWKFNEGTGSSISDSSGNGYPNGTAYNTTWSDDGASPQDPSSQYNNYGYDLFGFDEPSLINCINGIIVGPALSSCFVPNSSMTNVSVMSSRTSINDQPVYEMAALLYPPKPLVVGDAYLGTLDPNNFAYWGKNLVQNKGTTYDASKNAYWGEGAYDNILANDVPKYLTKITAASADAVAIPIGSLPAPTMFLQGTNYMSSLDVDVESKKYPNGKIWSITNPGGSNIGSSRTYKGKGTLIVKNNICFGSNVNGCVQPITWQKNSADIDKNQMGIIVLGDVTIASGSTIEAAIFCTGKMIVGDNVTLKGSFVAQSFEFKVNGVSSTGSGTRFIYDNNLNKNIPPIFGELNMPQASE